jgi:hypothetical protein
MSKTYKDFHEFWPFYVREHSKSGTRALHFIGTTALFAFLLNAIVNASYWSLLAGVCCAYGCAWSGHFLIEKNRPATFRFPFLSLLGDFKMFGMMLTGQMGKEIERINLRPAYNDPLD